MPDCSTVINRAGDVLIADGVAPTKTAVGGSQKRVLCSQLVEIEWEEDVQAKAKGFFDRGVLLALLSRSREQAPSAKSEGTPEEDGPVGRLQPHRASKFLNLETLCCQEAAISRARTRDDQVNSLESKAEFLAAVCKHRTTRRRERARRVRSSLYEDASS